MELETKRLVLRQVRSKDLHDLVENINNIKVSQWLLAVPYPYSMKDAKLYLQHCKERWRLKEKNNYPFVIALKSNDRVIGGCGIHDVNKGQGTAEVGYWLGEGYWRQGYGSEALDAMLKFIFKELNLRRCQTPIFAGNPSSGKLLEKFGFKREGYKRKAAVSKATGKIHDEIIYGLLKEEWNMRNRKKN